MSADLIQASGRLHRIRRILGWAALALVLCSGAVAGLSYWMTEPLEADDLAELHSLSSSARPAVISNASESSTHSAFRWPEDPVEGDAAKRLLLEVLLEVQARLDRVTGYTATFRKQERIGGVLRGEETLSIKIRHRPFAFYGKFLAPKAGKEVVYAEGHHENKVIVCGGGLSRLLVPRLALDPHSPMALADARHPVTDAGLAHLVHRLVSFRKLDLEDEDASTRLDRWTDQKGKTWYRSVHTHPHKNPQRPFAKVEVLYDPNNLIPHQITSYDWSNPADGQGPVGPLAERYAYLDLQLDIPLTALDFDPANPNYSFHRF